MAYTTINKSSVHFNTKLYTGNGGTNAQTGVGFQPDFTWIKARSNAENHNLFDAVRGVTKRIRSNGTEAEDTRATSLTAFGTDGFTLGSGSQVNTNGWTFASWNWKANGAGSANTDGSINSTVSANTTAGFSIVSFTTGSSGNNTYGHGLGSTPSLIIVRPRDNTSGWFVYHKTLGNGNYLRLNDTDVSASSSLFGNTTPTSSVFTINSGAYGGNYSSIAYCFAEKTGYSKFGSYVGNGNADGAFIYTGFKPAFVLIKNTGATEFWSMFDNKRDPHNQMDKKLYPNGSNAESTTSQLDFVSNGFKLRNSESEFNQSGNTMIYMCFAEAPLVGTNNVPCTAR
jgi:hypothetical protein